MPSWVLLQRPERRTTALSGRLLFQLDSRSNELLAVSPRHVRRQEWLERVYDVSRRHVLWRSIVAAHSVYDQLRVHTGHVWNDRIVMDMVDIKDKIKKQKFSSEIIKETIYFKILDERIWEKIEKKTIFKIIYFK